MTPDKMEKLVLKLIEQAKRGGAGNIVLSVATTQTLIELLRLRGIVVQEACKAAYLVPSVLSTALTHMRRYPNTDLLGAINDLNNAMPALNKAIAALYTE